MKPIKTVQLIYKAIKSICKILFFHSQPVEELKCPHFALHFGVVFHMLSMLNTSLSSQNSTSHREIIVHFLLEYIRSLMCTEREEDEYMWGIRGVKHSQMKDFLFFSNNSLLPPDRLIGDYLFLRIPLSPCLCSVDCQICSQNSVSPLLSSQLFLFQDPPPPKKNIL